MRWGRDCKFRGWVGPSHEEGSWWRIPCMGGEAIRHPPLPIVQLFFDSRTWGDITTARRGFLIPYRDHCQGSPPHPFNGIPIKLNIFLNWNRFVGEPFLNLFFFYGVVVFVMVAVIQTDSVFLSEGVTEPIEKFERKNDRPNPNRLKATLIIVFSRRPCLRPQLSSHDVISANHSRRCDRSSCKRP